MCQRALLTYLVTLYFAVSQAVNRFKHWNKHMTGHTPDREMMRAMLVTVPILEPFGWLAGAGLGEVRSERIKLDRPTADA